MNKLLTRQVIPQIDTSIFFLTGKLGTLDQRTLVTLVVPRLTHDILQWYAMVYHTINISIRVCIYIYVTGIMSSNQPSTSVGWYPLVN